MLTEILPKDEIVKNFQEKINYREYRRSDIDEIARLTPATCSQLGLSIWNEIVQKKLHPVNPQEIAEYVQKEDPKIHKRIANIIGKTVVFDIYYSFGEIESAVFSDKTVWEFFVAHIYPNTIYLADILIQNPFKPIPEHSRKFQHQTHEGFGLLSLLMKNLDQISKEMGCNQVSLTAATREHVPLFEKYGFAVQDSDAGRISMHYGLGIPMEKEI